MNILDKMLTSAIYKYFLLSLFTMVVFVTSGEYWSANQVWINEELSCRIACFAYLSLPYRSFTGHYAFKLITSIHTRIHHRGPIQSVSPHFLQRALQNLIIFLDGDLQEISSLQRRWLLFHWSRLSGHHFVPRSCTKL